MTLLDDRPDLAAGPEPPTTERRCGPAPRPGWLTGSFDDTAFAAAIDSRPILADRHAA